MKAFGQLMEAPIFLHVNYGEPWTSLEEVFQLAKSAGYEGVEIRRSGPSDLTSEEYVGAIARAVEHSRLERVIVGTPPLRLADSDSGERRRSVEEALAFYECLHRRVPLEKITLSCGSIKNQDPSVPSHAWGRHGSFCAGELHWEWAVEALQVIGRWLASNGLEAGLETHMFTLHDTVGSSLRLLERVGAERLGLTLDVSNLLMMPDPPALLDVLEKTSGRVVSMHWKNFVRAFGGSVQPARLKDGEVNHRALVRFLMEQAAVYPVVLEAPASGDKISWAVEDRQYILALVEACRGVKP